MGAVIPPRAFPYPRGVQLTKEVSYLNMREAAAAAALSKLWSDTFLTNAGIDAGNSANYVYQGTPNFNAVASAGTAAIPVMTTNTAPSGVASGSDVLGGHDYYMAFDGVQANAWYNNGTGSGIIQYDFGSGVTKTPTSYLIKTNSEPNRAPKNWTLEGSNNGTDWTVLDTQSSAPAWSTNESRSYTFSNSTAYRYFRLNIANSNDGTYINVNEFQIYEPVASVTLQTVRALNLVDDITSVIPFIDVSDGTLTLLEVSTDDGSTWTTVTADEVCTVPAGKQIKMRATLTGATATVESWGIAA